MCEARRFKFIHAQVRCRLAQLPSTLVRADKSPTRRKHWRQLCNENPAFSLTCLWKENLGNRSATNRGGTGCHCLRILRPLTGVRAMGKERLIWPSLAQSMIVSVSASCPCQLTPSGSPAANVNQPGAHPSLLSVRHTVTRLTLGTCSLARFLFERVRRASGSPGLRKSRRCPRRQPSLRAHECSLAFGLG